MTPGKFGAPTVDPLVSDYLSFWADLSPCGSARYWRVARRQLTAGTTTD